MTHSPPRNFPPFSSRLWSFLLLTQADGKDTVQAVKAKVEASEGIPAELQCLIFGGKQLTDER